MSGTVDKLNGMATPPPATHVLDCAHSRHQAVKAFKIGTQWWCDECKSYVKTTVIHPRLPLHERETV